MKRRPIGQKAWKLQHDQICEDVMMQRRSSANDKLECYSRDGDVVYTFC
jgi:hypothetical protein